MGKVKTLAIWWLSLQAISAVLWWLLLLGYPPVRPFFLAPNAPEVTLFAFLPADLLLFVGGALSAAWGYAKGRNWRWPALLVHSAAAAYAALFCISLSLLSNSGWAGAMLMSPSLIITPYLAWRLNPNR
jgi:hypothetical protein